MILLQRIYAEKDLSSVMNCSQVYNDVVITVETEDVISEKKDEGNVAI